MGIIQKLFKERVIFDKTRQYRYVLLRILNENLPSITFIMLNPSIADANKDDPTIRRIKGFANMWGYGVVFILNLFAYRSTSPSKLKKVLDPIGPMNDFYLDLIAGASDKIIVAWGTNGELHNRANIVLDSLPKKNKLFCLEKTKNGFPKHPLYTGKDIIPQSYGWVSDNTNGVIRKRADLMSFMNVNGGSM